MLVENTKRYHFIACSHLQTQTEVVDIAIASAKARIEGIEGEIVLIAAEEKEKSDYILTATSGLKDKRPIAVAALETEEIIAKIRDHPKVTGAVISAAEVIPLLREKQDRRRERIEDIKRSINWLETAKRVPNLFIPSEPGRANFLTFKHGVWSAAETAEALSLGLKRDLTKRGASAAVESSSSSEEPATKRART